MVLLKQIAINAVLEMSDCHKISLTWSCLSLWHGTNEDGRDLERQIVCRIAGFRNMLFVRYNLLWWCKACTRLHIWVSPECRWP